MSPSFSVRNMSRNGLPSSGEKCGGRVVYRSLCDYGLPCACTECVNMVHCWCIECGIVLLNIIIELSNTI